MATEITVGIAGAAGDGLDRTGDTLARTAARLGLHVYTYNSYNPGRDDVAAARALKVGGRPTSMRPSRP